MNGWAFVLMMDSILLIAVIAAWHLGGRRAVLTERTVSAARARAAAHARSDEFRRPAAMGPLAISWERVEAIRLAIVADQLSPAAYDGSTVAVERAMRPEGADEDERAASGESAVVQVRAVPWESTATEERAEPHEGTMTRERVGVWLARLPGAVAHESTEVKARTLYWLEGWRDNGSLFAMTGRAA